MVREVPFGRGRRSLVALTAFLLVAPAAFAAAAAPPRAPYSPEAMAQVREVAEARFSPDGGRVAFVTDITGAFEIWSVPSDGGWPTQLTVLGEQAGSLRYSPDGKTIAFISDFGGNERGDIFLVPADGGEAVNLTVSTMAESSVRFSPDGSMLAYTADPDREFLFQLMTRDLRTGAVRRLTQEPVNVVGPVWSLDGRTVAATSTGDDQKGELLLVEAASGLVRRVAPPVPDGILYAEEFLAGGRLLCRSRNVAGFMQLYELDLKSGGGRFVGPGGWDVDAAAAHPKAGVVFTRNEAGVSALYRLGPGDKAWAPLLKPEGTAGRPEFDAKGGRIVYLWGDSRRPLDVWTMDLASGKRRQLTFSLAGGVDPGSLAKGEPFSYKSFDGRVIHAIKLMPKVPRLGTPPPVVVAVHGGPNGQVYDSFSPMRQALAEAGFAVVAPNYRGSTGFGKEFEDANNKDWGGGDLQDIVWAVRRLGEEGAVDPKRAGVTGGSYGGYMTLMALAKSTGVWAAGVEAYGMPDLVQDYELTKSRFGDWYATEMGTPATHPALFQDRSAIHFTDRIAAPLLIFQGANDTNVPKAESELIHSALSKRGHPVEMVVYPDEGHGFTRRRNLIDYYRRTADFFVRWLGERKDAGPGGRGEGAGRAAEAGHE